MEIPLANRSKAQAVKRDRKLRGGCANREIDVQVALREDVAVLSSMAALCSDGVETDELHVRLKPFTAESSRFQDSQASRPLWSRGSSYCLREYVFLHTGRVRQVVRHLRANGCEVEGSMVEQWPQLDRAVQPEQLPGLSAYEDELLFHVRDRSWGHVLAPPNWAPDLIAALARFFRQENILVIAKDQKSVERVARELRRRTQRRVSTEPDIPWNARPLVRVESLSGLCQSVHDWQVLIFADVESAASDTGMQQAVSMPEAVIYSIIPIDRRLDVEDRLRLRITSGPEILRLNDKPFTDTKVTVLAVRAYRTRKKPSRHPLKHKRRQVWHNTKRNQQVAKIAEAFATKDEARLRKCRIPVERIERQLSEMDQRPRVAIVVESPEHARSLRRELPGWRLATGSRLADKHLPTFPLDVEKVIVTRMRAKAAGLAADVVVQADATSDTWSDDFGPSLYFNGSNMIVVDLQDTFDLRVRRDGRYRLRDYNERGWSIIMAAPVPAG